VSAPQPLQPVGAMAYPDERLAQFAERSHVPFVAWSGVLSPELYLPGGEWSREAHRVAAEALAPRICALF
jgi:hypothetical protein